MNGKRLNLLILILLIGLNLALFAYYCFQKISVNWVSIERMNQIESLYLENGIAIQVNPDRKNTPQPDLVLGEADLDKLVESFLVDRYDKSYIYGSKVQYTTGSIVILTDRKNHSISYMDESKKSEDKASQNAEEMLEILEAVAGGFARKWLGDEIYLSDSGMAGDEFYYVYHPVQEGAILYFNELTIHMTTKGVTTAQLSYWAVKGKTEKKYEQMPIDEILYAQLGMIKKDMGENQREEVVQIRNGYQLLEDEEGAAAVPTITIVVKSGRKYVMNRTAV